MIAKFCHGLIAPALLVLSTLNPQFSTVFAQDTAFTYQGRLQSNGSPASGSYNLTFAVFTDSNGVNQAGGTLTTSVTGITNGLFTVGLDFGPGIFTGAPLWLQIGAKTNGGGSFTKLAPLQPLTPTPYAIYASNAGSAATASGVAADSVTGAGIAGNSVVKSLNSLQDAVTLAPGANVTITPSGNTLTIASSGGGGGNNWSLTGNSGTTPGIDFLGTTDDQPLELHVQGVRGWQLAPTVDSPNVIGGAPENFVAAGVQGATIGGGGTISTYGRSYSNSISSFHGTIGGGLGNSILTIAQESTIAGGNQNSVQTGANDSAVGGGYLNTIQTNAFFSTIGGGNGNTIQENTGGSTIAGGEGNAIQENDPDSTIGGGGANVIQANSIRSVISGGAHNLAAGFYSSIVGGISNQATGPGAFVGGGGFNNAYPLGNTASGTACTVAGGFGNQAKGAYATVNGGAYNQATGPGAFVGGGGADGVNFGGNTASGADSTVGGGYGNQANGTGAFVGGGGFDGSSHNANAANGLATTVAGGLGNTSAGDYSTTGGGDGNNNQGTYATIGGGDGNYCNGTLFGGATIGGGIFNTNNYDCGTIGGGFYNVVNNLYATVPGGYHNTANGEGSLAAGESATANDSDSFVWGDGSRAALSQGADTFTVLATGGAYFYTTVSGVNVAVDNHADLDFGTTTRQMINLYSTTYGIGVQSSDEYFRTAGQYYWYLNGSHNDANGNSGGGATLMSLSTSGLTVNGTFVSASDRNLKEHFQAVDALQTLARVSALPITRWNYKEDTTSQHIGPMAQDFYAAFGVGPDDKHITTIDEGGVALAAIQGLNEKLQETQQALKAKDAEIQDLKQRLEAVEKIVLNQKSN